MRSFSCIEIPSTTGMCAKETMHTKQSMEHEVKQSLREIAKVAILFFASFICIASFGKNRAMKKEKHFGQVYTPTYLVQDILDVAGYAPTASILEKHVIDNSCGDGAFMEEVVRRYAACFLSHKKDKRTLARHLSQYIHGIELDAWAHEKCLRRLDGLAEELGVKNVTWDIRNADTLTVHDYDGMMDYVVGNPPYVRVHNLAENFDKVKAFKFCNGGMTDLYLVFYEIGLNMLSEGGVLCYIAPSSWINSLAGKNMRDHVRENCCLRGIVDLGHYQPFEATAYTAIVTLGRDKGEREFDYGVYDGEHKMRKICRLKYDEAFFADSLYLGDKKTLEIHREITMSHVPKYVQVKNGFATLADNVFIADEFPFTEYVIPVIKASTGKWRKAIYPYDNNGKPISKDDLFGVKPIADYMNSHQKMLLKGKRATAKPDWYLYGRTQALKDVFVDKYAVNTCIRDVKSIKFNPVPAGSGLYSGLYIITKVDEQLLRQALLSDGFINYIAALKKYKSGGYYTFSSRDLEQYLNYALHQTMPKAKRKSCQGVLEL